MPTTKEAIAVAQELALSHRRREAQLRHDYKHLSPRRARMLRAAAKAGFQREKRHAEAIEHLIVKAS